MAAAEHIFAPLARINNMSENETPPTLEEQLRKAGMPTAQPKPTLEAQVSDKKTEDMHVALEDWRKDRWGDLGQSILEENEHRIREQPVKKSIVKDWLRRLLGRK